MVPALTEKFRPALDDFVRSHWPGLGSLSQAGIALQVSNSRLMLRRPGYVIKPHRDPRWAFLTCLVYLPKSAEHQIYGTQLYRLRQEPELTHNSPLWADLKRVRARQGRSSTAQHCAGISQLDRCPRSLYSSRCPCRYRAIPVSGPVRCRRTHAREVGRQPRRGEARVLGDRPRLGVLIA